MHRTWEPFVILLLCFSLTLAKFTNNGRSSQSYEFYDTHSELDSTTERISYLDARLKHSKNITNQNENSDRLRPRHHIRLGEGGSVGDVTEEYGPDHVEKNVDDSPGNHPDPYPNLPEDAVDYDNIDYDDEYYSIVGDSDSFDSCNNDREDQPGGRKTSPDLQRPGPTTKAYRAATGVLRSARSLNTIDSRGSSNVLRRGPTTSGHDSATVAPRNVFNLSDEFLNCMLTTVEPECYQVLENGSVFVPLYEMVFDRGNFLISEGVLLLCPDFFDKFEEKFSSSIDIISVVGALISTVFIVLHIIMFSLVDKMRNLPGYCMFSMCLALLAVYVCSFVQFTMSDSASCAAVGMIIYYSLLASYFWMNVISYDVWQCIRMATNKLRLSSERPVLVRFCLYSLYSWGAPVVMVAVALVTDHLTTDERYKLEFNDHTCWFRNKNALLVFFALPLFLVLFVDVFFFVSSFYMIHRSIVSKSSVGGHSSKSNLRSRLFLTLKLTTAMGLMWLFGVIATLTQRGWLYYLYSVFNALQGVFIFFSFSVNENTIQVFKNVTSHSILQRPFPKPSFYRTTAQTESGS